MDWLMMIEVAGGLIAAFAGTVALGVWLCDVRTPPASDPRLDNS